MGKYSPEKLLLTIVLVTSLLCLQGPAQSSSSKGCPDARHRLDSSVPDGLPRIDSVVSKNRVAAVLQRNASSLRRRFHYKGLCERDP